MENNTLVFEVIDGENPLRGVHFSNDDIQTYGDVLVKPVAFLEDLLYWDLIKTIKFQPNKMIIETFTSVASNIAEAIRSYFERYGFISIIDSTDDIIVSLDTSNPIKVEQNSNGVTITNITKNGLKNLNLSDIIDNKIRISFPDVVPYVEFKLHEMISSETDIVKEIHFDNNFVTFELTSDNPYSISNLELNKYMDETYEVSIINVDGRFARIVTINQPYVLNARHDTEEVKEDVQEETREVSKALPGSFGSIEENLKSIVEVTSLLKEDVKTFGEKLVGISFNPAMDSDVDIVKRAMANIADSISTFDPVNEVELIVKQTALQQVLLAQMAIVKLLTIRK